MDTRRGGTNIMLQGLGSCRHDQGYINEARIELLTGYGQWCARRVGGAALGVADS